MKYSGKIPLRREQNRYLIGEGGRKGGEAETSVSAAFFAADIQFSLSALIDISVGFCRFAGNGIACNQRARNREILTEKGETEMLCE